MTGLALAALLYVVMMAAAFGAAAVIHLVERIRK